MSESVTLEINGRPVAPQLPPLLKPALRSVGEEPDPFLPPGYLVPTATFDVGPAARSAEGEAARQHTAPPEEVLVIELADRSTLITSAAKLKASLEVTRPDLIGPAGEILFEKLRAEGAAPRGLVGEAVGGLVSRVFALTVGAQADEIIKDAKDKLGVKAVELGVTWAGTKALMWAIEKRLKAEPGTLSRWVGAAGGEANLDPLDDKARAALQAAADPQQPKPILVFVHGTGSSTLGSFGDLRAGERDVWAALERQYTGGIYAFEHRTLSESPIDNAVELARALPRGAHVSLVSHSRGGLVADLLCLRDFDALIESFKADELPGTGDAEPAEAKRVKAELAGAHAEHREQLRKLAALLRDKQLVVERYVRVASPARGTKLASGNFDVFLSGLLTLIGQVPFFFGSPLYMAFKRVVLEIAKNRTNAHLVPGIEAMLPDSPMARLLRDAPVSPGIAMAVIAGDIEGGGLLKRLGVLLTDFLLFDNVDNDLVVDTAAMLAGIAPQIGARALFDRGAGVSHFAYFSNLDTRFALRDWLVSREPAKLPVFQPMPARFEDMDALEEAKRLHAIAASRGADPATLPVVVLLPGVMGSHLWVDRSDRIWFDPADIARGKLDDIAWGRRNVEAEKLFSQFYGRLAEHLAGSHRIEAFAYDWRQPLDVLGERLGEFLDGLLKTTDKPIRLLAHSMGGLVVRACIYKRRAVMDALMQRDGARFVMLGTPNQGASSMVENLTGKGSTLRTLVRLDLKHKMQQVLDIVAGFRGALQLLPRPGFVDTFQGDDDGGIAGIDYGRAETWTGFKPKLRDFWFGDGNCATPAQGVLDAASWLWAQDGRDTPALPEPYAARTVYVSGVAPNTPCGVREEGGRLKMVGTTRGDGTVTWDSGRIGNIGNFYWMSAEHGELPSTAEHFPALAELLTSGSTNRLERTPPALRAAQEPRPITYDAGPPTIDDDETIARALMGGMPRTRLVARPQRRLEVTVKAMDLRFLRQPIMVGHYEHDPIAGPQKLIDRELLDGDLSERYNLGLYPGPRGTATVVLRTPNEQERRRGSLIGGVVTGFGPYERPINQNELAESVRAGVLRYLLHVADVLGREPREVPLASLLLGYNSSANLTVAASVEALVSGVLEANAKFFETTRLAIRVHRLDIVELYLDTAITAVYALRQLAPKLQATATRQRALLVCRPDLLQGEGLRQRLFDARGSSYWPRLIVTDAADRDEDLSPPGRTAIADRLRFLYVGQRARAESVVQQRQPGLIEALVRQQIDNPQWNADIARMLFQLMVPHDFKDAARELARVVLVVDGYTANLPWELMSADDARDADKPPLALRVPVVRQLASPHFRRQVRQNIERSALVVGNPSVEGFKDSFKPYADPGALSGAEQEAQAVAAVLGGLGYDVTTEIGADRRASDVLAALYRKPYRFVHISAHGVFDLLHVDGRRRSGVVLSDGLLITAAEIDAMETVPELVFLNCCHLGKVDATVRDGNKLAASIARELIQIGVRCVVVAGWAVADDGARIFGETFYRQLLLERHAFGDAVFAARQAVWERNASDITWGAFQAYGDAGWMAEPRPDGAGPPSPAEFASPEELLDALASLRAEVSRKKERQTEREIEAQVRVIKGLLDKRCPPEWLAMPALLSALGATWASLGRHEDARKAYLAAVQAEDKLGRVPIRDIEQLANMEARLGERNSDQALIDGALTRLDKLDQMVAAVPDGGDDAGLVNAERSALRGSAWKRIASVHARRVLAPDATPADLLIAGNTMSEALANAVKAYQVAEGDPAQSRFSPYQALNRLALDALTPWIDDAQRDAALALAQQCAAGADEAFRRDGGFFGAVMQPEALLVQRMLDRSLGASGGDAQAKFDEVAAAYANAMSNITATPNELDSLIGQLCLMSRFHDALSVVERSEQAPRGAEHARMATRLIELAERIQPGGCRRDDRPRVPGQKERPLRAAKKARARAKTKASAPRSVDPPAVVKKARAGTKPKAAGAKATSAAAKRRRNVGS